jgi:methyl-accepting chemotaxis protein
MARAFFNEQIKQVMDDWRRSVGSEDAALFAAFAKRVEKFREFHRELVRRGVEIGPEAGREWGDNDANRSVRKALNDDLTRLAQVYAERSRRIYEAIDRGMARTAWLVAVTGALSAP